ncbi:MAG TPA: hypothetical protein PLV72_00935 [Candidatus Magasanikbacteria bacterium]|nr:hypothetical protein [Candidatus Magasanikbacteria bacterium]
MSKPVSQSAIGDVHLEWTVSEYEQYSRGPYWYIIMGSIGLFLVIYAVFTGNFMFALVIILSAIILFLQSHQMPNQIKFQITDTGVVLGRKFYAYSEFKDFYLFYNPPEVKTLFLQPISVMQPTLRVPLLDQDPTEVKFALRQYLAEDAERSEEPTSDTLSRRFKIQ